MPFYLKIQVHAGPVSGGCRTSTEGPAFIKASSGARVRQQSIPIGAIQGRPQGRRATSQDFPSTALDHTSSIRPLMNWALAALLLNTELSREIRKMLVVRLTTEPDASQFTRLR